MKANNLNTKKGISISQASTISNLCFQTCREIANEIAQYNNMSKKMHYEGKDYMQLLGKPISFDIIEKIKKVGEYSACQGFLMENIKAKDQLLYELRNKQFEFDQEEPEEPKFERFIPKQLVNEIWGFEQLSSSEINDFILSEAYAAHIGGFIHKGGKLDFLRNELPTIQSIELFKVGENVVPVEITKHHTSEDLFMLHEELSKLHSTYEQKVNYYKSKVKNLVSDKNSEISKDNEVCQSKINDENQKLMRSYNEKLQEYKGLFLSAKEKFEQERQKDLKETAQLRIEIPSQFKEIIDKFISLNPEK